MAWVAEDGKRQLPTHPLWTDVPDKVWDTIDVAETIAQKIGKSFCITTKLRVKSPQYALQKAKSIKVWCTFCVFWLYGNSTSVLHANSAVFSFQRQIGLSMNYVVD